jgi:apolipoprotein D and lipocalin family protein
MKKKHLIGTALLATVAVVALNARQSIPKGAIAVKPFDKVKYLGKWYEIARFDYRFEKNLNNVTATYTLNTNGTIRVDNRGYDVEKNEWKESIGKAKPAGDPDEAKLKVSFFGPFYAPYNVIAIDDDYKYALVVGKNLDYLWLLSREKTMPDNIQTNYLKKAQELGYPIRKLVWVKHDR